MFELPRKKKIDLISTSSDYAMESRIYLIIQHDFQRRMLHIFLVDLTLNPFLELRGILEAKHHNTCFVAVKLRFLINPVIINKMRL